MHVVIAGFGRVGQSLAHALEKHGHSVAVIDRNRQVFEEYGQELKGRKLTGEVFDRETLVKAGIERADAFAAVTSGDNSNIVSARIARERYGVKTVAARIYDPRRAVIYERFGIPTVCSVQWASARLFALLEQPELRLEAVLGGGEVMLMTVDVPTHLTGRRVVDVEIPDRFTIASVSRDGEAMLVPGRFELMKGDRLHIAVTKAAFDELKQLLGLE